MLCALARMTAAEDRAAIRRELRRFSELLVNTVIPRMTSCSRALHRRTSRIMNQILPDERDEKAFDDAALKHTKRFFRESNSLVEARRFVSDCSLSNAIRKKLSIGFPAASHEELTTLAYHVSDMIDSARELPLSIYAYMYWKVAAKPIHSLELEYTLLTSLRGEMSCHFLPNHAKPFLKLLSRKMVISSRPSRATARSAR